MRKVLLVALIAASGHAQQIKKGSGSAGSTSLTIAGTSRKISVSGTCSGSTINCTITLPSDLLLPIGSAFTAATTSKASFNVPSGSAPSAPLSGDFWNLSGLIQFYNGSLTKTLAYKAAYTTVSYSSTPTFTALSNVADAWAITLTGNVSASTLSGPSAGQRLSFKICQDGSGSHTFAWPTGFSVASDVDATAGNCTYQNFTWNGSAAEPIGGATVDTGSVIPGDVTLSDLAGSGNAFACLDSTGKIYRSGTSCN